MSDGRNRTRRDLLVIGSPCLAGVATAAFLAVIDHYRPPPGVDMLIIAVCFANGLLAAAGSAAGELRFGGSRRRRVTAGLVSAVPSFAFYCFFAFILSWMTLAAVADAEGRTFINP